MSVTSWLRVHRAEAGSALRLLCFPYAGGSASVFHGWHGLGAQVCAVELPGRAARLREPAFDRAEPLVRACVEALLPHLGVRFALFGHSLGALVAYETASLLEREYGRVAERLFVSGRGDPRAALPGPRRALHTLPDAELIEELRGLAGTPPEVLANEELMRLVLPALRADFAVHETYRHERRPALGCPLVVLGGANDVLAPPTSLQAWRDHTRAGCEQLTFPGGHFFIHTAREAVLAAVAARLAPAGGAGRDQRQQRVTA